MIFSTHKKPIHRNIKDNHCYNLENKPQSNRRQTHVCIVILKQMFYIKWNLLLNNWSVCNRLGITEMNRNHDETKIINSHIVRSSFICKRLIINKLWPPYAFSLPPNSVHPPTCVLEGVSNSSHTNIKATLRSSQRPTGLRRLSGHIFGFLSNVHRCHRD